MKNETVTIASFCHFVGLNRNAIKRKIDEGQIKPVDGMTMQQAVQMLVRHFVDREVQGGTLTEEKTRKERALADIAEIERDKRKNKLVLMTDVEEAWESIVLAFRARALAITVKLPPLLAYCRGQQEMHAALTKEIHDALKDMAKPVDYKIASPEPVEDNAEANVDSAKQDSGTG